MFDKAQLKEQLTKYVADVVFIKADGTNREMTCTLMPSYLPAAKPLDESVRHIPRKENDDVLAVWDLDNNGWRSFRLDSIIEVNYIEERNYATSS
jgi:hypothetical protein